MDDYNSEDFDRLKKDIKHKLEVLKENTDSKEDLERLNKLTEYLALKDSITKDDAQRVENLEKIDKGLTFFERFKNAFQKDVDIDPGRLLGLTDGIFGMVMTLLIFGIAIPELTIYSYSNFISFFSALAPTVGVTIVSFVLISSFWIYHHEFIKIKNLNIPYLWLNIFFLICISFIPFSTSLIGNYSHFFISEVLFGINILLTIISFLSMYLYAYSKHFLENNPSRHERKYVIHTFAIIMGLTVIVNLLDFKVSSNFIYLFLLIPVISTIRDITFKMDL